MNFAVLFPHKPANNYYMMRTFPHFTPTLQRSCGFMQYFSLA
jgi:hypothetical protein